ncbi:serine protease AprX [Lachnospiraceae bacterium]|jgi:subtilisin family serine protease|nr:serine protease AprX [Lachnospiraceae bacterium]
MNKVKQQVHYRCYDTMEGGIRGQNVTVAILDTGMSAHPDLKGRILAFYDCVNRRQGMYDDSGHGTHVGGILAGDGRLSKGEYGGMAPKAELVIVKVLDSKGEGSVEQILEGIQWIQDNHRCYNIRVVNVSVGAREGLDEKKEKDLIEAVEILWDLGITVVVSAGNQGPKTGSIAVPGNSRKVITVGALDEPGMKNPCSGVGPTERCIVKPELVAPGYHVASCNSRYFKTKIPYVRKSGTSMATPVVSGAAALFLSKYPEAQNVDVKLRFRKACECAEEEEDKGWGCLRLDLLLK